MTEADIATPSEMEDNIRCIGFGCADYVLVEDIDGWVANFNWNRRRWEKGGAHWTGIDPPNGAVAEDYGHFVTEALDDVDWESNVHIAMGPPDWENNTQYISFWVFKKPMGGKPFPKIKRCDVAALYHTLWRWDSEHVKLFKGEAAA